MENIDPDLANRYQEHKKRMKLLEQFTVWAWYCLFALVAASIFGVGYYTHLERERAANRIPEALRAIQNACLGGRASIEFTDPPKVYCEQKPQIVVPEEIKP